MTRKRIPPIVDAGVGPSHDLGLAALSGEADQRIEAGDPPALTDLQYHATQQRLVLLAQFASDLPVEGFLRRISNSHAIAPMLDPTLYMRALPQLGNIESLARSVLPFVREIRRQLKEAGEAGGDLPASPAGGE